MLVKYFDVRKFVSLFRMRGLAIRKNMLIYVILSAVLHCCLFKGCDVIRGKTTETFWPKSLVHQLGYILPIPFLYLIYYTIKIHVASSTLSLVRFLCILINTITNNNCHGSIYTFINTLIHSNLCLQDYY